MNSCKFIKPGLLTTIQDSGRTKVNYFAIPVSGVLDKSSAELANLIVGNKPDSAVIECNLSGPSILFNDATVIAVTGADMQWTLNGKEVIRNCSIRINSGDLLVSKYAREGLRAYLAIQGNIVGDKHFDSYSSYNYAGLGYNNGAALSKDHILEWQSSSNETPHIELTAPKLKQEFVIHQGPEYNLLNNLSTDLLSSAAFSVTADSNRMGARLSGPPLEAKTTLGSSVPVLPGFIQLLPSGQLIVILQDGQTTGGYPRIAYLKNTELDCFNQLSFNQAFRFTLMH